MSDTSKALEALDRIFNYCEEIDLHIPEEEQTGYIMNDDVAIIREALFENKKTGHWIDVTNGRGGHKCDNCHDYAPSYQSGVEYLAKYCPNCGAKMEGERE